MKKYYQLVESADTADLYIYGDITSYPYFDNDVSAAPLVKEIDAVKAGRINVYINSYGGEVAEALAIISALNRSNAKVTTFCDGFACSAAAAIFMAGEERWMAPASLLMIHNAWMGAVGDSDELRKLADDLETINDAAIKIYLSKIKITEDELRALLDAETWIIPSDALSMGFATGILQEVANSGKQSAGARKAVMQLLLEAAAVQQEKFVIDGKTIEEIAAKLREDLSGFFGPLAIEQKKTSDPQRLLSALFS